MPSSRTRPRSPALDDPHSASRGADSSGGVRQWSLTEAQSGLWYAQRLDPGNPLFNTGHRVELFGPLDRAAFRAAVEQAVGEADALCLHFRETPQGVFQFVDERWRPHLQVVDVAGQDDPHGAALALLQADMDTAVDPEKSPLAVEKLFVLGAEHHVWYQRVHHLAIDGYGTALLNQRIAELYNARVSGTAPDAEVDTPFAPLSAAFDEDAAYRSADKRNLDAAYWHDYLAGLPEVPGMAPGRAVSAHRFHRESLRIDADAWVGMRTRAEQAGVVWPDWITAFTAAYCQRFAGASETVVGVPFMGRLGSATARVPAMVMNVLPLRVVAEDDAANADFLRTVSKALLKGRRHGRYRSEQMRRDLGLLGGHRRLYGPLVNVLPFDRPFEFAGLDTQIHTLSTGPVDDITFTFRGDGSDGLLLEVDGNPELYTREENAAHARRLIAFLQQAVDAATPGEIPLATPDEETHAIEGVNRTAHALPDTTLTALIEAGMRRVPENPALIFGAQSLNYAELEKRTRALALQLRGAGVGPEDLVAIALPRSCELVIALLAVLRAGAAYLPLDPEHPPARIARILESAKPKAALSAAEYRDLFGQSTHVLEPQSWNVDPDAPSIPGTAVSPQNLAYVIYTSGSTGEPKGVMIEHRAIVNRLEWMRKHYGFEAGDRILQKTPATFDVSVWEFFLPFISGASLIVAPPGAHREPAAIARLIREHGITTAHFVPSMLSVFLNEPSARGLQLRRVFCSGEELTADLCVRFHDTVEAQLHNLYGPTEAAVDVSYWPVPAGDRTQPVPIGFPVWNTRLYVLDDRLRSVPDGVTGHLYLAGVQLARGYLGRDDLTAERFVADPFVPGERMYLTGDLARRRADGAVVFLGRSDHQVKIRGLRIELGEIEAALMSSGLAKQVAVIVREDRAGQKRLVAYLVPEPHYAAQDLRAHLSARLPEYMVPSAFVELDELPTTANGKLNRAALPQPDFAGATGRAPEGDTERKLAALYAEVLELPEPVYADSDFFSLGGDSLLAVTLMLRIQQTWGRDPGLGALFEQPEVAGLARRIDAQDEMSDNGLQPLLRLASGDADLPPLFVVHPAGGISWCYRQLARSLSPNRTVYGLQAPSLDPAVPHPRDIESLAADYVERMREVYPQGPYHIAGWSVGGIVVQAMAVHLQERHLPFGVVALLDAYPSECWRAAAEPTPAEALRALLAVAGFPPDDYPELVSRDDIVGFLKRSGSPLGALPDEALDGVIRVVLDNNRLVRAHYHRRYAGTLLHFRAALDHRDSGLTPALWQPHAQALDVVDLPFLHSQLTGASASEIVARVLSERMAARETFQDE